MSEIPLFSELIKFVVRLWPGVIFLVELDIIFDFEAGKVEIAVTWHAGIYKVC